MEICTDMVDWNNIYTFLHTLGLTDKIVESIRKTPPGIHAGEVFHLPYYAMEDESKLVLLGLILGMTIPRVKNSARIGYCSIDDSMTLYVSYTT